MADERFSLKPCTTNSWVGGSSAPMAGGGLKPCTAKSMGFSLQRCTHEAEEAHTGEEGALKREALPIGVEGCATKRKKEDGCTKGEVEEATEVLVDSNLPAPADDPLDGEEEEDFAVFYEKLRSRYAARVKDLFGPNSRVWSGLHNPYPPDDQDGKKEEELGAVDDGTPPPVST